MPSCENEGIPSFTESFMFPIMERLDIFVKHARASLLALDVRFVNSWPVPVRLRFDGRAAAGKGVVRRSWVGD